MLYEVITIRFLFRLDEVYREARDFRFQVYDRQRALFPFGGFFHARKALGFQVGEGAVHVPALEADMAHFPAERRFHDLNHRIVEDGGIALFRGESEYAEEPGGLLRRCLALGVDSHMGEGEAVNGRDRLPAEPGNAVPVAGVDEVGLSYNFV